MADSKLSALTAATDLTSAEFYVAQSGASKRAPVALLTKSVVGLGNVDNTSDANKPISTATQTALDAKAPTASPTFTGTVTTPNLEVTSNVITSPSAMGALAINVTERLNTKTVSADSTFTFSATPTTNAAFGLRLTEGGSAARTITIPSSYSQNRGAAITSFTLPASATVDLVWHYDGTTYYIFGDPVTAAQVKTGLAITASDLADFNSATRAQVEAELVAGSNITITPGSSGATRTLTIASTGGGGGGIYNVVSGGAPDTDYTGADTISGGAPDTTY